MAAASSTDRLSPFVAAKDGVRAAIRLTPKASRRAVGGLVSDADGGVALKVSVTEPPDKGKANTAILKYLKNHFKVPMSNISLISGASSTRKVIELRNLSLKLEELMEKLNKKK